MEVEEEKKMDGEIKRARMRRRRTEGNREQMEGMVGDRREKGQE